MKYGNTLTEYAGRVYASRLEADYAQQLDLRKTFGEVRLWLPQQAIILVPAYVLDGRKVEAIAYVADFVVVPASQSERSEIVDAKGHATEAWRLKWKLLGWFVDRYELAVDDETGEVHRCAGPPKNWPLSWARPRLVVHRRPKKPKEREPKDGNPNPWPVCLRGRDQGQKRMSAEEFRRRSGEWK